MPNGYKIFGGTANPELVKAICKEMGVFPGKINVKRFADGEIDLQIVDNVRGNHAFVIQPTCAPADTNIMELILIADALNRSSAKSITAVLPYFGYARQDRKDKPRKPISASVVAKLIEMNHISRVLTLDLHSAPIQGFFDIPVDHLYALPIFVEYYNKQNIENLVVVSPDIGGVPRARLLSGKMNAPLAVIDKRREKANESEVMNVIGDVSGKNCLMIDDLIDTAGTLVKGAQALLDRGALSVRAAATHGVLSKMGDITAHQRIEDSSLIEVMVTDSIPQKVWPEGKIKVLSSAPLMASAIDAIINKTSVSSLFV